MPGWKGSFIQTESIHPGTRSTSPFTSIHVGISAGAECPQLVLAAVMQEEYRAIVQAGFLLQVDCPDLAMTRVSSSPI